MRERPVRLGHPVRVFLLLDRVALAFGGEDQLGRQALGHGLLVPAAGERDQPAHGQRRPALRPHLDRHLERGAADPAALHLERGLGVVHRLLEHGDARLPGPLLDQVHRPVEDPLGDGLLALEHQVVDELGDRLTVVPGIGRDRPLHRARATAHFLPPLAAPPPRRPSAAWRRTWTDSAAGRSPRRVQRAAHDVVAHARQILHAAAADEHDRVLLEVVAFARDVGGDLEPVGEPNAGHLAERRVGLLRGGGVHPGADAALLRVLLERRRLVLGRDIFPAVADELIDRRHKPPETSYEHTLGQLFDERMNG